MLIWEGVRAVPCGLGGLLLAFHVARSRYDQHCSCSLFLKVLRRMDSTYKMHVVCQFDPTLPSASAASTLDPDVSALFRRSRN